MFEALRNRKVSKVFDDIGVPSYLSKAGLMGLFEDANGIAFNPWNTEHVRVMRIAVTRSKLKFVDQAFDGCNVNEQSR